MIASIMVLLVDLRGQVLLRPIRVQEDVANELDEKEKWPDSVPFQGAYYQPAP